MPEMKAIVARVTGRVQGVWFRDSARRIALGLNLSGWAQNIADGAVETFAQGDPGKVDEYVAWLHHGPPRAVVVRVETEEIAVVRGLDGFEVR
jgi:acylphosphatase